MPHCEIMDDNMQLIFNIQMVSLHTTQHSLLMLLRILLNIVQTGSGRS